MRLPLRCIQPVVSDVLRRGARIRMSVTGSSMLPWIKEDDVVELEPLGQDQVRTGDVVMAGRPGERWVLHRVVRIKGDQVFLRGDAQFYVERIPGSRLMGRAVAIHRGERVLHLDRGLWRLIGLLWALFAPLGAILFQLVITARRTTSQLLARCRASHNHSEPFPAEQSRSSSAIRTLPPI